MGTWGFSRYWQIGLGREGEEACHRLEEAYGDGESFVRLYLSTTRLFNDE